MKRCVACAEEIQEAAQLCKHCGTMQNDRRFQTVVAPLEQPHLQATKASQPRKKLQEQRVCKKCNKYVVVDRHYDFCDVCRGLSTDGVLPNVQETDSDDLANATGKVAPGYLAIPLAPTPGIAIAAIVIAFFIPILGLILGYAARAEVRNPNNPKEGEGLATGAIVIGWLWIVIGIVWIVALAAAATNAVSPYN